MELFFLFLLVFPLCYAIANPPEGYLTSGVRSAAPGYFCCLAFCVTFIVVFVSAPAYCFFRQSPPSFSNSI